MKKGFTLVELSIVLVIIGLLIGGILVAQSLIESAQIKKVISTANQFKIMTQNFVDKTKCLPGDCGTNIVPNGYHGNNDGALGNSASSYYTEPFRVAFQLQYLGVYGYEGSLSHCNSNGTDDINCFIKGPHEKSIFSLRSPQSHNTSSLAAGPYGMPNWRLNENWLVYGQHFSTSPSYLESSPEAIITPIQAKSIDTKVDDGGPSTGNVRGSRKNNVTLCLTTTSSTPGVDYDLSKTDPECNVFFYISHGIKMHPDVY